MSGGRERDAGGPAVARRLEALESAWEIEQLKYRYAAACDGGFDVRAIAECFTAQGRWVAEGYADCTGREAIMRYFRGVARATREALHYVTNPRIEIAADGRRAVARFDLWCAATTLVPEEAAVVIIGTYADRCVREDGAWRFEEMRTDVRHVSEWTAGWVNQPWMIG